MQECPTALCVVKQRLNKSDCPEIEKDENIPPYVPNYIPFFLPFLQAFVHRIVSNRWEGKQQVWKRTLELNAQAFAVGPVNLNRSFPRFFLSV